MELATEVINLSRNILITGDYDRFDTTNNGIHTLSVKGMLIFFYFSRFFRRFFLDFPLVFL